MARIKTSSLTVSNAGQLRNVTLLASTKSVGRSPTGSSVEFDGLQDLVFDPDIVSFEVQPESIHVWVGGIRHRYTPDARCVRRNGEVEYREFKLDASELDATYLLLLDAVTAHYRQRGQVFKLVAAKGLRSGHRMDNIRALRRYRDWPVPMSLRRQVQAELNGRSDIGLGDLQALVGPAGLGALYRLLFDGDLLVDLNVRRLDAQTAVWGVRP